MLPSRTAVDNLIKVVLHAQDNRSAQQIFLDMAYYYFRQWQQAQQADTTQQLLTVLQAFCELGLGWQKEFDQLLAAMQLQQLREPLLQQINFSAMVQKPTRNNLIELLRWRSCQQNPLQPTKKELVTLLHSICQAPPHKQQQYSFFSPQYSYQLYWQTDHWCLQDCRKQVVWHLCK